MLACRCRKDEFYILMIELIDIAKSYDGGHSWAIERLSLHVRRGEFLVLLGESGCGKTTTLKMINRLIEPTRGRIEVDGQNILALDATVLRRRIGYVLQNVGLFPHMTIAGNVAVVPQLLGWRRGDIRHRVDELLSLVNLDPLIYRDRLPVELSGGQRQRVGLARALAARAHIMLMDEPFGALDPLTRDSLRDEYRRLHEQLGLTTVMVTHDMTEALLLADRVAVISAGQILRIDTPHNLLVSPGDPYVQRLMQSPRHQADRLEALLAAPGGGEPGQEDGRCIAT